MTKRTGTPGADDILREELANGLILLARENESNLANCTVKHFKNPSNPL